jgi:hypothetical protein
VWNDRTRFRLSDDVTYQSLGTDQDTVVLSLTSGYLYTCNETTASFLRALDGKRTFGEVLSVLEKQYEVPLEQLRSDLQETLAELLREKLIVPAESPEH